MDPNYLTKRSWAELRSMPFDSLYDGVHQQAQISQQILQDFKLPMPQLSYNNGSKHRALPEPAVGSKKQRSTRSLPPPEYAYHDTGLSTENMPEDRPLVRATHCCWIKETESSTPSET
eukprot:1146042-Pelagomonas_calceolata.AAC.1